MIRPDKYTAFTIRNETVVGDNANAKSDIKGCDLLDDICGNDYIYNHPEEDDDYIYTAISNLTNSERRKLINGCIEIINKYHSEPFDIDKLNPENERIRKAIIERSTT